MREPSIWNKFRRSNSDYIIFGLCGGLGETTSIPTWAWRSFFLFLVFCFGTGLLIYVIFGICVPDETGKSILCGKKDQT